MTRYHKDIFFPDNDKLPAIVSNLNQRKWVLSKHSFDRIIEKSENVSVIGYFIKDLVLKEAYLFEYYKENDIITKLVFRIPFDNEKSLILVLSDYKNLVTVYFNNCLDNHKTLDKRNYTLENKLAIV